MLRSRVFFKRGFHGFTRIFTYLLVTKEVTLNYPIWDWVCFRFFSSDFCLLCSAFCLYDWLPLGVNCFAFFPPFAVFSVLYPVFNLFCIIQTNAVITIKFPILGEKWQWLDTIKVISFLLRKAKNKNVPFFLVKTSRFCHLNLGNLRLFRISKLDIRI